VFGAIVSYGVVSVSTADRRPVRRSGRHNAPRAVGRSPTTERDRRSLKQSGRARRRRYV